MWPGLRSASLPSGVFIHPAVWPQETWAKKLGGVGVPFLGVAAVSIEHKVAWAEAYLQTKWQLDASRRLATIKWAENWGGSAPVFVEGSWIPIYHNGLDQGMPSAILIYPAVWPQYISRKLGRGLRPLFGEGSWFPI